MVVDQAHPLGELLGVVNVPSGMWVDEDGTVVRPPETACPARPIALFRVSHRLAPDNWTCRRQAWTFADPAQGPTAQYDSDWLSDVRRVGAENYYAPVELEPRRG